MGDYRGFLLLLRSTLLSLVIVALAAGAHVIGGGVLPAGGILLALMTLLLIPVTVLMRKRLSLAAALSALGVGQFLLHGAFGAFSNTGTCITGPSGDHALHAQSLTLYCLEPVSGAGMSMESGMSIGVLLAHVAAVIVTAAAVASGESALQRLWAWLRPPNPPSGAGRPPPPGPGTAYSKLAPFVTILVFPTPRAG